jgi:hypothetical protein
MHAVLAKIYHLSMRILLTPIWRAPVAAFTAGLLLRLLGPARSGAAACLAVLAGWAVLGQPEAMAAWPLTPLARLAGAAVILLIYLWLAGRPARRFGWLVLPAYALVQAWWLRGAPLSGNGLANSVPVFLGLYGAAAVVRRLAARDSGVTTLAAAASLAASLYLSGGSLHWSRAALVIACAGVSLLGRAEAAAALAQAVVVVAVAAIVASDRGRFAPVDAASLAPLLVWFLAPRLLPRLNRAGPALAGGLAAVCGVALAGGLAYALVER